MKQPNFTDKFQLFSRLLVTVLVSAVTPAMAANQLAVSPYGEQPTALGAITSTGAQSFVTALGVTNISGAGIYLTPISQRVPNEQQSITVALWDQSLLTASPSAAPLATGTSTGGRAG